MKSVVFRLRTPLREEHFQERTAAPQISPLRYASVEMTKGSTALSTLSKNIPREGPLTPQISPLRSFGSPVEMTKGRAALPATVVAEQDTFFIALGGPLAHDSSGREDKGRLVVVRSRCPGMGACPSAGLLVSRTTHCCCHSQAEIDRAGDVPLVAN